MLLQVFGVLPAFLCLCSSRDFYIDAGGRNGDTLRLFSSPAKNKLNGKFAKLKEVLNPKGKSPDKYNVVVFEALPTWCSTLQVSFCLIPALEKFCTALSYFLYYPRNWSTPVD